jgi:hypothetical protein
MKNLAIRIALVFAYLIVSSLMPFNGILGATLWDTFAALTFAFAILYFTGKASIFVPAVVLLVSLVFPLVILCEIGLLMYHSWPESAKNVVHNLLTLNPYHSFYMLIPTITATILIRFVGKRVGPNS